MFLSLSQSKRLLEATICLRLLNYSWEECEFLDTFLLREELYKSPNVSTNAY